MPAVWRVHLARIRRLVSRDCGLGGLHRSWSWRGRRAGRSPIRSMQRGESPVLSRCSVRARSSRCRSAWFLVVRGRSFHADLYFGTVVILVVGAIAWGARLGDFTMFYLFFGGIAVIATPVAAVAIWTAWDRLRATRHIGLAFGFAVLCFLQLELGVAKGAADSSRSDRPVYAPVPATCSRRSGSCPRTRSWPTAVGRWTSTPDWCRQAPQHRCPRRPPRRAHVLHGRGPQYVDRRAAIGYDREPLLQDRLPSARCTRMRTPTRRPPRSRRS